MNRAAGAERHRLRAALVECARTLGLELTDSQVGQLLEFLDLLSRWNRTYNLTAIRDLPGMLSHHVVDCLAVVGPLRRERAGAPDGTLLDVGSGGGLPGLIIAVMEPSLKVTCVDAVGKKAAFVRQAAASLGLENLSAEHTRIELMSAARFDMVVSRAFASLSDFTRLTRQLLNDQGAWMAMKGKRPDAELAALPESTQVFHVEPLSLPDDVGERCLVWMRPASTAPRAKK